MERSPYRGTDRFGCRPPSAVRRLPACTLPTVTGGSLRRWWVAGVLLLALLLHPLPAAAHGMGPQGDLPLPLEVFLFGAGLILVAAFAVVVTRRASDVGDGPEVGIPERPVRRPSRVAPVIGVVGLVLVIVTGIAGVDNPSRNMAPVLVNVLFWLGLPLVEIVFGDLYASLNPWRALARWTGLGEVERPRPGLGIWPATIGYLVFVWFQVVSPLRGMATAIGWATAAFTLALLWLAAVTGRETAVRMADPFTTYNGFAGAISPLGTDADGGRKGGWLHPLARMASPPGMAGFVAVMIGAVLWDGLSFTPWWLGTMGNAAGSIWLGSVGLIATSALVLAAMNLASRSIPGRSPLRDLAPALAPLALAATLGHHLPVLLFEGQLLFSTVSDPLGMGWDLFGTADQKIAFFATPATLWWFQASGFIAGGIASIIVAHRRVGSLELSGDTVRREYGMLLLMVTLTLAVMTVTALA